MSKSNGFKSVGIWPMPADKEGYRQRAQGQEDIGSSEMGRIENQHVRQPYVGQCSDTEKA